jgi:hypothetical protein
MSFFIYLFFRKYIGCYTKEERWRKLEERGFVEAKFYTKLENSDIEVTEDQPLKKKQQPMGLA